MQMKAYAEARSGARVTPGAPSGRGMTSMSQYYRRYGVTGLGGNARTRGRLAPIRPVRTRGRA